MPVVETISTYSRWLDKEQCLSQCQPLHKCQSRMVHDHSVFQRAPCEPLLSLGPAPATLTIQLAVIRPGRTWANSLDHSYTHAQPTHKHTQTPADTNAQGLTQTHNGIASRSRTHTHTKPQRMADRHTHSNSGMPTKASWTSARRAWLTLESPLVRPQWKRLSLAHIHAHTHTHDFP